MELGSIAELVMAGAAVMSFGIAVVALVVAAKGNGKVKAANKLANEANVLANETNFIALQANTTAQDSQSAASEANRIALESVEAARRSADAAEAAEQRQRLVNERATENHRVNWDVIWVGVGNEFKLQLRNHGPHDAHKVIVQVMHNSGGFRYDDFELIAANGKKLLDSVSSGWLWKGSQVTLWWNSPKGQVHSQECSVRAYPDGDTFLAYANHPDAPRDGER